MKKKLLFFYILFQLPAFSKPQPKERQFNLELCEDILIKTLDTMRKNIQKEVQDYEELLEKKQMTTEDILREYKEGLTELNTHLIDKIQYLEIKKTKKDIVAVKITKKSIEQIIECFRKLEKNPSESRIALYKSYFYYYELIKKYICPCCNKLDENSSVSELLAILVGEWERCILLNATTKDENKISFKKFSEYEQKEIQRIKYILVIALNDVMKKYVEEKKNEKKKKKESLFFPTLTIIKEKSKIFLNNLF